MNTIVKLALIFMIGGSLGWVTELIFRRTVHKKWINPGFLVGPCLPLYGVGLLCLYLVCSLDYSFIASTLLRSVFIVLLIAVLMTLIEYITGLVFIKAMRVKLWDYSSRWGNIQGIICPLFSMFWTVIGGVYYFLIHPYILDAVEWISVNQIFSFVIGMYYGVLIVDICYSFNMVGKIRTWANEHQLVVKIEELKLSIHNKTKELKQKSSFLLTFKDKALLHDMLERYKQKH